MLDEIACIAVALLGFGCEVRSSSTAPEAELVEASRSVDGQPLPATEPTPEPKLQPEPEPEPAPDPDGDGVPSPRDLCPDEAGSQAHEGCAQAPLVTLGDGRLELHHKIEFEFDKSTIRPGSYPLLEQVARLVLAHPEWGRIEIQGHRNPQPPYGRRISQGRAQSVKAFLVERGVPEPRLEAKGYGDSMPLVPHEGYATKRERDEAWATNRRIEFVLLGADRPKKNLADAP